MGIAVLMGSAAIWPSQYIGLQQLQCHATALGMVQLNNILFGTELEVS